MDGAEQVLPHGAKGLEVDDLVVEFLADKVIVLVKSSGDHYTLHSGKNSGVLDVHRTWKDESGQERHKTLFAIRHDSIAVVLSELSGLTVDFVKLIRPLRLGWLGHHKIGIVWGLDPICDEDIAAVTRKRQGRKRLIVDEEEWASRIIVPEYLEDVLDFPDGPFAMFARDERIGVGFKVTDQAGSARLFWIKLRDLSRLSGAMGSRVLQAFQRHAIPPERYPDIGFLKP
ncbi:MAG: hypothetical protein IT165_06525 [Bryobacterales bacterium]|nr:hypothetical protein [Bryobacterales bacterium]